MDLIQQYAIYIIIILLALLAISIIYIVWLKSETISQDKYDRDLNYLMDKIEKYKYDIGLKDCDYARARTAIDKLQAELLELKKEKEFWETLPQTRRSGSDSKHSGDTKSLPSQEAQKSSKEQNPVPSNPISKKEPVKEDVQDSNTSVTEDAKDSSQKQDKEPAKEDSKKENSKLVIMYSSFPRAGSDSIYFTDLTSNMADDSYFELKISKDLGKATFRPLDFMKIRNYDPAMAAMQTEGMKPNVASTVLNIEPGVAHIDGKYWIIDNPAKIKLA